MNLSERIETFFDRKVVAIRIGIPRSEDPSEQRKLPKYFVQVDQMVPTGPGGGNFSSTMHQKHGNSIVECFEQLQRVIDGTRDLEPKILEPVRKSS